MSDSPEASSSGGVIQLFKELIQKAKLAELEASYVPHQTPEFFDEDEDPGYVELYLKAGRSKRRIFVNSDRARLLLKLDLSAISGLGDYSGIVDRSNQLIEVVLTNGDYRMAPISRFPIWELPGAEILDEKAKEDVDVEDDTDLLTPKRPTKWRLRVEDGSRSIEISPTSDLAAAFIGRRNYSLKIHGFDVSQHDTALAILNNVGGAFLFDLDVRYGIALQFVQQRNRMRPRRQKPVEDGPTFPRNQYSQEALVLYQYGRSSGGLPLLQFLAFYQSLEYFFPVFAREETVNSLRAALLHPRFNPTHDGDVNRLINLAAPAVKAGVGEREQLRATVRASIDENDLRNFIEGSEMYREHFCESKQKIMGASPIKLKGDQADLRDQVSDRLYKIRCRVVHTKQDGSGQGEDLLLPSSSEVDALGPDIDLLRLIAQQALVARAKRSS